MLWLVTIYSDRDEELQCSYNIEADTKEEAEKKVMNWGPQQLMTKSGTFAHASHAKARPQPADFDPLTRFNTSVAFSRALAEEGMV